MIKLKKDVRFSACGGIIERIDSEDFVRMRPLTDKKLLRQLRRDPALGMRQLAEEYTALVAFIVRGRLESVCSTAQIEELISDVFVEFYVGLDRFDPARGTVKAYICAIAKNLAAERYDGYIKESGRLSFDDENVSEEIFMSEYSVPDELIDDELRRELIDAVNALGEPDREIIVRKFYLREPSKTIAAALGMTVSAVDTRTHRALGKLKEKLTGRL